MKIVNSEMLPLAFHMELFMFSADVCMGLVLRSSSFQLYSVWHRPFVSPSLSL